MVDMGLFCVEFGVLVGRNTDLGRAKKSEWAFDNIHQVLPDI
jgi:hypothetical protein